jgi:transcriptional repressor NF-X1
METAGYPAEVASATGLPVTSAHSNQPKRRNPRQARPQDGTPQPPSAAQPRPPRRPRPPQNPNDASAPTAGSSNATRDGSQSRNARRKQTLTSTDGTTAPQPRRDGNRRKANFGAGLTQTDATENQTAPVNQPAKKRITRPSPHPDSKPSETPSKPAAGSSKPQGKGRAKNLPQGDDLTSILIRDLSTPPYPDCPICFSAIRPEQAIWSCSPSISIVTSSDAQVPQYCWTSFHVKCIRSWAEKSVKEVADAWRARGESDKKGDWRCPGCQAKRETVPSGYWYVPILLIIVSFLTSYPGVSVTRPPSQNHYDYPRHIRAETRVLVHGKVAAGTHVLSNATRAPALHVKSPLASSAIAQRRASSLSDAGLTREAALVICLVARFASGR